MFTMWKLINEKGNYFTQKMFTGEGVHMWLILMGQHFWENITYGHKLLTEQL